MHIHGILYPFGSFGSDHTHLFIFHFDVYIKDNFRPDFGYRSKKYFYLTFSSHFLISWVAFNKYEVWFVFS